MFGNEQGSGAGIIAIDGASLVMNGGEISDNESSRYGGGIMLGTLTVFNTDKGATFTMNGGKISGNNANDNGGGIFIQCLNTATLNSGEITNNSCRLASGVLTDHFGGAGVYVNGGKGFEDGKLYIPNAYISDNTAKLKDGAGIAGCGTSTVIIYPETATIYNNHGTSQIYVDTKQFNGNDNKAKTQISQIAVGKGINNWENENGKVSFERLNEDPVSAVLKISNDNSENLDTEGKLSPVKITGNISGTRGGGIGSNGYIEIGKEINIDININKIWRDGNNAEGTRPENVTIKLYADGKIIDTKEVTQVDDWKCTFESLPKYKNDTEIEYTIAEDDVDGYSSNIDGYNIVNYIETSVEVTKTWIDNNNSENTRPEKVIINLLKNGVKVASKEITQADDWKCTFEGLEKYDKDGNLNEYTITEDKVDGYKTTIDGFNIINKYEDFGVLGDEEEENKEPSDDKEDDNKPSNDKGDDNKPSEDKEEDKKPSENSGVLGDSEEDEEKTEKDELTTNAKTGDNINLSFTILIIALLAQVIIVKVKKKR